MQKHTDFELEGVTYKAFHSLDNLYRIEDTGINLTELCVNSLEQPISLTLTRKILEAALLADIQDKEKTRNFVNNFIDKKRFLACNIVREFILSALTTPKDDTEKTEEKKDSGKLNSLPYDNWSGFAYCELNWSPSEFWGATAWDIVSAMIFHNKKHASDKKTINKKELTEFRENMKIKGVV